MGRDKTEMITAVLLGILLLAGVHAFAMDGQSGVAAQGYPRGGMSPGPPGRLVAAKKIYYSDTIKSIVTADCARCHSGAARNLMDYDSLKAYADSGVLAVMVQGPMAGFAGDDARTILAWIDGGALEQPAAVPAAFGKGPGPGGPCNAPGAGKAGSQVTYENTIKFILDKDCLRCHSGPFRNLTTYENLKVYVDNGLLQILVQRGGPMHRFAGPDSRKILGWVKDGAPLGSASL
jgi:hypothetical protein